MSFGKTVESELVQFVQNFPAKTWIFSKKILVTGTLAETEIAMRLILGRELTWLWMDKNSLP